MNIINLNSKILKLKDLKDLIYKLKKSKKRVALCHGVFDQLHIGHIHHFNYAKRYADILVVTITHDKFVNKGPARPIFNFNQRLRMLASLQAVDFVACNDDSDAVKLLQFLKPNFYIKGPDYKNSNQDITGKIIAEKKAAKKIGCKIIFTDNEVVFSSSKIINSKYNMLNENQSKITKLISKKYSFDKIKEIIDNFKNLKILIVGETIIDDYVFCEGLGKSGKESVLTLRKIKSNKFLGGALAIARHLNSFSKNVTVLSYLGNKKDYKNYIYSNIEKSINLNFIYKKNSPTILKKRFLDIIDNRKLLGIYELNDDRLDSEQENQLINKLKTLIPKNDIVLIADYGHGLISKKIAKYLSAKSTFITLNAQQNSGNIGFSELKKYSNIDCVVINATELKHEMRERDGDIINLAKKLKDILKCKEIIVTQGRSGLIMINKNNKIYTCPAFAREVVDKIGAGDALLSLLSMCKKNKVDDYLSTFLSSLAAAQSVESIGNSKPLDKNLILKSVKHILM